MLCNFTVWREHLFCALNCPNHKFGSNPNILSFVLSKLWNIFQRLFFFNVNYFARSPPLGHINLLCANSSHSLRWYLCLPKVPWMCIQSHTNSVNIPSVSSWFCTQLTSDSNFNSSSMIFFFVSLLHFHLCWAIFAFGYPFSCHLVLSLEDGKSAQFLALLSVHELITDVPWVSTGRLWKKPCDWSLIKRSICYTWIDLCTEGAVEFLFDETAHNHN